MFQKGLVKSVGFDLDETLYPSNPQINDIIRGHLAEAIRKKTGLSKIRAREVFDAEYTIFGSGSKTLTSFGYTKAEADQITDEAAAQEEIIPLIKTDSITADIVKRIYGKYNTFLITSSPQVVAHKKLEAIGIQSSHFHNALFGDSGYGHKADGEPFLEILNRTNYDSRNYVYVGNSKKADILPAKSKRMQTIAVWSNIPEASISISHIHDLERLLL